MSYEYKCDKSKDVVSKSMPMEDVKDHPCQCGGTLKRHFRPGVIQIQATLNEEIFDHDSGNMIKVADIDRLGKETGKVWLGNEEATSLAKSNRERNERQSTDKSEKALDSKLRKIL